MFSATIIRHLATPIIVNGMFDRPTMALRFMNSGELSLLPRTRREQQSTVLQTPKKLLNTYWKR